MAAANRIEAMITSPIEPEHVERLARAFPDQVELIYRPDLMPALRYIGDHGDPVFRRTPEQDRLHPRYADLAG